MRTHLKFTQEDWHLDTIDKLKLGISKECLSCFQGISDLLAFAQAVPSVRKTCAYHLSCLTLIYLSDVALDVFPRKPSLTPKLGQVSCICIYVALVLTVALVDLLEDRNDCNLTPSIVPPNLEVFRFAGAQGQGEG